MKNCEVSYDLLLCTLKIETTARGTNSIPFHSSFSNGIICGPHRGSFAGSLAIQFRSLRSGIICGAVHNIFLRKCGYIPSNSTLNSSALFTGNGMQCFFSLKFD